MRLPTKNIIPITLACTIAVGSVIVAVFYPTPQPKITRAAITQQGESSLESDVIIQQRLIETDSDSDGLKDWEESLWGTSPINSDTDGDKTKDGAEIAANRNPLVKGPKDHVASTKDVAKTSEALAETATTKLAQDLFAQYMKVKQSGQEIDPDLEKKLIQNLITTNNLNKKEYVEFHSEDIDIINDSMPASKSYGNKVGAILSKYNLANFDSELIILEQATQNQKPKELEKLKPIIAAYEKVVGDLLDLEVPRSIAQTHLDLINSFSLGIRSDEDFLTLYDDPTTTFTALTTYQNAAANMGAAFRALDKYFKSKQIVFSENEPGYTLTISF